MWDSSFMADMDNFSEINENFDTIKTLLNSIRAQGILNTSDVDKLLSGINNKLEKINTEEDIDLIKIFLSELKQTLDERHSVLVSKFGAIESLFSNLLKSSSELPKSTDIKELFDIVATNLSVFSREVVSQKESLTDITLRLDAIRSDNSQKKDIIKNITLLKPDLERLNNGFDSIVISLNDNFKTIVKTISTIDKTEYLDNFSNSLNSIETSSNTVLSAIQMLDKKTEMVEEALKSVVTRDDLTSTNQKIFELTAQSHELNTSISNLSDKYLRIDNLAEKIDASVNIIATLKSALDETDDNNTRALLQEINTLGIEIEKISSNTEFEEFKSSLEKALQAIDGSNVELSKALNGSSEEVQKLISQIKSLDINLNFQTLFNSLNKVELEIKNTINESTQKINNLQEANITRVINEISTSADSLNSRLNSTQSSIAVLCEKNFNSVFENVIELKTLISQIDENSVSANNAIFSSITDRLTLFENSLRNSLETQENNVSTSAAQLVEHVENIKNISNILDYKMDSSVVEIGNVKREFGELKSAIDSVLALDFVNTVKDLRVDLYASKQELSNSIESASSDLSEKFTNDLYGKYELLISKLDTVEDEIKKEQAASLSAFKGILENISSSIVDVLSYVSEFKTSETSEIETKIVNLTETLKENNLGYVESVRDVVDIIRVQIENNLKSIEEETSGNFDNLKRTVSENSEDIKKELKYSYSKLLEIQDAYAEIKELLNIDSSDTANRFDKIFASTDNIKTEFDTRIASLRNVLLDKITDFKQELTCENADKVSELKFSVENLYTINTKSLTELIEELKVQINNLSADETVNKEVLLSKISDNFASLREFVISLNDKTADDLALNVEKILSDFEVVKAVLEKVDENVDADMTRQLSIIESNFESLVSQITILFDKADNTLVNKINQEFSNLNVKVQESIAEKLEGYKLVIEETFGKIETKAIEQSSYLQDRIAALNTSLKKIWEEQSEDNLQQIEEISQKLKAIIEENIKLTAVDYVALKEKLNHFAKNIEANNQNLTQDLKAQLDDITKYIDSVLDIQAQDILAKYNELAQLVKQETEKTDSIIQTIETNNTSLIDTIKTVTSETSANEIKTFEENLNKTLEDLIVIKNIITSSKTEICDSVKKELDFISQGVEKETDIVVGELIEQFDLLKKSQADEVINLTSRIEEVINAHIYNNIEDLKSYLDIKTDSSVINSKLDNLKLEINSSIEDIVSNLNKLLDSGVFASAMSDYRVANEILINSSIDKLNSKIESFIKENLTAIGNELDKNSKTIEEKLALFDKKFVETLVDKYEEAKLISNETNSKLQTIESSIADIITDVDKVCSELTTQFSNLANTVNETASSTQNEVKKLTACFEDLRSQISNRAFDEAFQASINKQINSIETLIRDQFGYLEDINDMCSANLPDLAEMSTLLKHSICESLIEINNKFEDQNLEGVLDSELKKFKSDIITQFLNIFNQVSFVAEQEEILDFIQEKHDELITILSHIVTTTNEISSVKDNMAVVDNKIDTLKDDIGLINEKITAIISADGDIDYVYSLQDLESDIANLRIVLNEMRDNDHGQDFDNLINSTNDIYALVESIKTELPTKKDFETIAEDIVSISTRTNKLILASDESYKSLHDNLQEFKLVINDLDERTRNFARESGLDRIDTKLNALNSMVQSGAKTNQVFNQVFEYLAEWVDNASIQINSISDKVETLDDIGQIKTMLADLKAGAEDNSESVELIEALGAVFDKQTKRISSLETKLDKIIVETTINNKNNQVDLTPFENTLNKFLVSMDEKITAQQEKILSLEAKLENIMEFVDSNETAQLTKKMGGMDRQIAKLNKSIEKIASHVVEK